MKNSGKFAKIVLTGIGLGILGYLISRKYKKSISRQEKVEEQRRESLKSVGVDPDRFDEEMIPGVDDDNLVKALYLCADSKMDKDIISIGNCIDNDNVIHLRQYDQEGMDKTIDILFEIPETSSDRGNYNVPKISDYINSFMDKKNELEKKLLQQIRTGLEGYFIVEYTDEQGHKNHGSVRIPKELHLSYAFGKNDGLTDYIDKMRSSNLSEIDLSGFRCNGYNVTVLDIKLLFKLSIRRESVNLVTLDNIINSLVDFEVKRKGYKAKTVYEYIMFNAYCPSGGWSLMHYYTKTQNGIIAKNVKK